MPLAIEWPDGIYERDDALIQIQFGSRKTPLYNVGLELLTHDETSPIQFRIFTEKDSSEYELRYSKAGVDYVLLQGPDVEITIGKRRKLLREWFQGAPPIVRFEQDSFTEDNQFCRPFKLRVAPFSPDRIEAWTWKGVNLRRESQTQAKFPDSIQYRVIEWLKSSTAPMDYDIIFDDDDTREAADVVAIAIRSEFIVVHLFHCKYSAQGTPGAKRPTCSSSAGKLN